MRNKVIVLIVVVAVIAVAGAAFALNSFSGETTAPTSTQIQLKAEGYDGQLIAGSETPYVRYNEADFEKAMSEGKAIYIYFYATWCPICVVERPKVLTAFDQLGLQNAVGFEAHWNDGQNTEADDNLARKYGVASQHTHIFIGRNGDVLEKTLEGLSSDDIRTKLTEAAQV